MAQKRNDEGGSPWEQSVSIYDIAKVVGVSPSTVSRALNNRDRIGSETRRRIVEVADRLGYQPSAVARSLTSRRTNTFGVVAPRFNDPLNGGVFDGIEQAASEHDYRVLFSTSQRNRDRELLIARSYARHRVDAVIIVASHLRATYELFLEALRVPLVIVGQQNETSGAAVVTVDDFSAIASAANHLLELGHRSFAYVGARDRPYSDQNRREGFARALADSPYETSFAVVETVGENEVEQGPGALEKVLEAGATAVMCYNDLIAIGLLSACARKSVRVPEELSIVGFDDIAVAPYLPVPLTTIHQPAEEIGRTAVSTALDLIDGAALRRTLLSAELIVRETTAKPKK